MDRELMIGASVLVALALVSYFLYWAVRAEHMKSPRGTLGCVCAHVVRAVSAVHRRKWLVLLPVGALLASFLLFEFPDWLGRRQAMVGDGILERFAAFREPLAWTSVVAAILAAPLDLIAGYLATLRDLPIVPIAGGLAYFFAVRALRRKCAPAYARRFALLSASVAVLLASALLQVSMWLGSGLLGVALRGVAWRNSSTVISVLQLSWPLLTAASLIVSAALAGWIVSYVAALFRGESPGFGDLWNRSLSLLPALSVLNLLGVIVFQLPSYVRQQFVWFGPPGDGLPRWLDSALGVWGHVQIALALAFWLAPLVLVLSRLRAVPALIACLRLIPERFFEWGSMTLLCVFALASVDVLHALVSSFFGPMTWPEMGLRLAVRAAGTCVAVVCSLALISFAAECNIRGQVAAGPESRKN